MTIPNKIGCPANQAPSTQDPVPSTEHHKCAANCFAISLATLSRRRPRQVAERQCSRSCHHLSNPRDEGDSLRQALQDRGFDQRPLQLVERRRDHRRLAIGSAAPSLGPPALRISAKHTTELAHTAKCGKWKRARTREDKTGFPSWLSQADGTHLSARASKIEALVAARPPRPKP